MSSTQVHACWVHGMLAYLDVVVCELLGVVTTSTKVQQVHLQGACAHCLVVNVIRWSYMDTLMVLVTAVP